MSKTLKTSNLNSRPIVRTLAAVSLSISLAAFGCTTDRTLGDGDPVVTPGVRTSPTGNTSAGSETPSLPQPMFSSSIDNGQSLPTVTPRSRADQAAAILANQQPRVRYLGVAMPGNSGRPYYSDRVVTGAFQNPALRTNPQLTVNSSISSAPTPVIASGAGEGVGGDAVAAGAFVTGTSVASTTGASIVTPSATTGVTAGSTATGTGLAVGGNLNTGAAPIFASPATTSVTTTGVPTGALATTLTPTTSPTAFSALNPPTAISGFPALAANSTVTQSALANGTSTTTGTTVTTGATTGTVITGTDTGNATSPATTSRMRLGVGAATGTTTSRATSGTSITSSTTAPATSANPVRLTRDANGRVTITNQSAQRNR